MHSFLLLASWGIPRAFAASKDFLSANPKLNVLLGGVPDVLLGGVPVATKYDVDAHVASDFTKQEVKLELTEHRNAEHQVTSFDLKVSLARDQGEPMFFICSYLVTKMLSPSRVYDQNDTTGEFILNTRDQHLYDHKNFVQSKEGHGTRISCEGRIQVRNASDGSNMSIFENARSDTAADITMLQLQVYEEEAKKSTTLFLSKENDHTNGKFYVTGRHNNSLFREGAKGYQQITRRRLDYYKFACRNNKKMLTVKIGVVADHGFCTMESDNGPGECENAAMAVVFLASSIMEKQLNVRLHMADFISVSQKWWSCDNSVDFMAALDQMTSTHPRFPEPKRAVYHMFTNCLPPCYHTTGCRVTLGLAYNSAINFPAGTREKVAVNRFTGGDTGTFLHEMGHSLGFNHFFSIQNRNVDDFDRTTAYGIMDYVPDQKIADPQGDPRYNGIRQFTPRHDNQNACKNINQAQENVEQKPEEYGHWFSLKTIDAAPTTTQAPPQPTNVSSSSQQQPTNGSNSQGFTTWRNEYLAWWQQYEQWHLKQQR